MQQPSHPPIRSQASACDVPLYFVCRGGQVSGPYPVAQLLGWRSQGMHDALVAPAPGGGWFSIMQLSARLPTSVLSADPERAVVPGTGAVPIRSGAAIPSKIRFRSSH